MLKFRKLLSFLPLLFFIFEILLVPTVVFANHGGNTNPACHQGGNPFAAPINPAPFGCPALAGGPASSADLRVNLGAPAVGISPGTSIGGLVTNAVTIVFIIAALLVLFFLIWGAFDWITSGGDKEKVASARKKIFAAIIGLVILAIAYFIVRVVGSILNIDILNLQNLPKLGPKAPAGQECPGGNIAEPAPVAGGIPTCG